MEHKRFQDREDSPHLRRLIKKMCDMVDCDYDKFDFETGDWYQKYEWTEDTENAFGEYFRLYLKLHVDARKELMNSTSSNKRALKKCWDDFNLMWGWKVKE